VTLGFQSPKWNELKQIMVAKQNSKTLIFFQAIEVCSIFILKEHFITSSMT